MNQNIRVRFDHGLGDCVYFAHQLPLYQRRGFDIEISCNPDKRILFEIAGATTTAARSQAPEIPWYEGREPTSELRHDNYWLWSKLARNLSLPPMPDIGHPGYLWDEYTAVTLDAAPYIPPSASDPIDTALTHLPPDKKLILLHTTGATDGARKDIPTPLLRDILETLIRRTEATILLLDWHGTAPLIPHYRIRHMRQECGHLGTAQLLHLIARASLLIGVDSGPLHAARFTSTPAIGVWMNDGSPATWSLPRAPQANIVIGQRARHWTKHATLPFNILECDSPETLPALLATAAGRLLATPAYLPPAWRGRDALTQHLTRDRQPARKTTLGGFDDRDTGFDHLLTAAAFRFAAPFIVETGCITSPHDSRGSTLLLALFAASHAGELVSIDHNPDRCALAREVTGHLGPAITVLESDSVAWLSGNRQPIDILHLDTCDPEQPGSAVHTLQETEAAIPHLHQRSIIVIDDTPYAAAGFIGAGALAVPFLLSQGWQILFSGHQTILSPTAP